MNFLIPLNLKRLFKIFVEYRHIFKKKFKILIKHNKILKGF